MPEVMSNERPRSSPLNEDLIADAKRRYAEAEVERQKIYRAIERLEARKRNRSPVNRLLRRLGFA